MTYVDFHCDTLMQACSKGMKHIGSFPEASVDIERLRKAEVSAQFFAAFVFPKGTPGWKTLGLEELDQKGEFEAEDRYIAMTREILAETIRKYPNDLLFAKTGSQILQAKEQGKTAAFFTLEDGRSVDGSLGKLERYHDLGVSLITLTWNYENCFGYPNSTDKELMTKGLKTFGKEAVEYMNQLGMVVDVSHLSDGGFWDVVRVSKKPFVASHSNCRELSPHPRNLTDEMIRALAEKGGMAGLNFCASFLNRDIRCVDSRVEDMVTHIVHMVNVGGLECVGLGTDFDGIGSKLEIQNPLQMELLFEGLRKAGFSQDAIEQIAWKNAVRVLQEIAG